MSFFQTYGETTFHRAQKIVDELRIKPSDVFVDLGSGWLSKAHDLHSLGFHHCYFIFNCRKVELHETSEVHLNRTWLLVFALST